MENGVKKSLTHIYVHRNTCTPFKWPRYKDKVYRTSCSSYLFLFTSKSKMDGYSKKELYSEMAIAKQKTVTIILINLEK